MQSSFVAPLSVAAIVAMVAGVFWTTSIDLAGFGSRPDRSADAALVVAIFLYIVWDRRTALAAIPAVPFWPGVAGVLGAGFCWLVGQLIFVRVLTDLALVAMVWSTMLLVFGHRWFVALAFPLLLLTLAVPVWEPLIPMLTAQTADIAVSWLQASGIPIYRDGAYFVIPSGSWVVKDACSGIAYFSTCLILGPAYAWIMYRSMAKRVAFVAAALVLGIVGNWIRVYLTVLIAHLSGNRFLRDDHEWFGWVLYAAFLMALFRMGRRYRDDDPDTKAVTRHVPANPEDARRLLPPLAVALIVLAAWPVLAAVLARPHPPGTMTIADIAPENGWSRRSEPSTAWIPDLVNPTRTRVQAFEKNGRSVDVFTGVFVDQTWTSKLVTSVNQLAAYDNKQWALAARGNAMTQFGAKPLQVRTGILIGSGVRLLAWRWYWIDGSATPGDLHAKFLQLLSYLGRKGDASAWMAITTRAGSDEGPAAVLLDQFMHEMGGSLEEALRLTTKSD